VRRYWFIFDVSSSRRLASGSYTFSVLLGGVGVTGFDELDCLSMVRDILPGDELPAMTDCIPDVCVADVILPGWPLGVPVWRGVWYPPFNLGRSGIWRPVGASRADNPSVWPPNPRDRCT
jgi:hypothetical protein